MLPRLGPDSVGAAVAACRPSHFRKRRRAAARSGDPERPPSGWPLKGRTPEHSRGRPCHTARVAQDYILCEAQVGNASGIPLGANGIREGPVPPFQGAARHEALPHMGCFGKRPFRCPQGRTWRPARTKIAARLGLALWRAAIRTSVACLHPATKRQKEVTGPLARALLDLFLLVLLLCLAPLLGFALASAASLTHCHTLLCILLPPTPLSTTWAAGYRFPFPPRPQAALSAAWPRTRSGSLRSRILGRFRSPVQDWLRMG